MPGLAEKKEEKQAKVSTISWHVVVIHQDTAEDGTTQVMCLSTGEVMYTATQPSAIFLLPKPTVRDLHWIMS